MTVGSTARDAIATWPGVEVPETLATVRLLLVEDQPGYARLITERLKGSRHPTFTTQAVGTLAEAEKTLAAQEHDVILLDLNLPDSAGLDTVRRAKAAAGDRPIVVLTGMDDDELAKAALQAGAQDYLSKDVAITVVVRAMVYALERARTLRQLLEADQRLKTAQMHLIQADKMETVGRLAAGVAHEIKNPLAIIQMAVDCLVRRPDTRVQELSDVVRDIQEAVQRAYLITNQLLSLASPADLVRKPMDLHVILLQALHMVQHELKRHELRVETDFAGDLPPLMLDRSSMEQAFVNLLTNAAHATPPGGVITVRTHSKTLDVPGNGVGRRATDQFRLGQHVVVCEIEDTGRGIKPDDLPRLFDPFFTTKPQGEGTGLGLGIVKNILDLHGGRIEINNRAEGGVRVTITLVA